MKWHLGKDFSSDYLAKKWVVGQFENFPPCNALAVMLPLRHG
jgi:hypothetical protein